jgi:hypothetical protein
MRRSVKVMAVVGVLGLVGCGTGVDEGPGDVGQVGGEAKAILPTGKTIGTLLNANPNRSKSKISYHNGAVLTGTQNVYYLWYGDWSANTSAQAILTDLGTSLGNSPYMQVNNRYTNASGVPAASALIFGGSAFDTSYSHGTALADADFGAIISDQINAFRLPQDPTGIYVVLTSADVTATSGFCSSYCGQHNTAIVNGAALRWIFVGAADRCPTACSPQAVSPNGNAGADAMASTLAGELSDTVTDPALTGWYDRSGFDNADKCAWTYGTTYTTSNGSQANVRLGSRDWLLQRNFWPTSRGGVCVMNSTQAQLAIANGEDLLPE